MIVDARTYTILPGKMSAYLKTAEEIGLPIQKKHGFNLRGYFTVETGGLNKAVHYWEWENAQARQDARDSLNADPDCTEYRRLNSENIAAQDNRLLQATDIVEPFAFMGSGSKQGFVDERTYTITYAQVPQYIAITKALAKPIVDDSGWRLIGYFFSITGTINQVVHLWYWDNHGQREACQTKAVTDPRWAVYQAGNGHRVVDQNNRYLVPTSFSPIQ